MSSVLKTPWRRIAQTTAALPPAFPRAPSSRAWSSSSSKRLDKSSQQFSSKSLGPGMAQLVEVVSEQQKSKDFSSGPNQDLTDAEETAQPKDTLQSSPLMTLFHDQSFLRPIDLRRDFREPRGSRQRRPPIGPGREARCNDIFLQLGIDPRFECENTALMSDLTSRLGKIQPRNVTLLSQRSQRLVGKAVKRAKMMGIIPMFSNRRWN